MLLNYNRKYMFFTQSKKLSSIFLICQVYEKF